MSGVDDLLDSNSAVYRTLLESTLAIPWKIDWATMKFAYIGPQIEPLLGWERDSWISADDWATRIHADDREHVVNFCISQSKAGVDHEADYRALTRDNGYVWIRDVVHVVRDDKGEVEALVGFMFDISERKKTEARLLSLQKELEALSFKDGLTGAANRRMFDARLDQEWKNAARSGQPLSVILLDIDYFKQYNDFYGHIRADERLTQVAQTLMLATGRPGDLVARFGGEEFVLLLPETGAATAREIAECCQRMIGNMGIPHEKSPISPSLTVSMGVGTATPLAQTDAMDFMHSVDQLLYAAKQNGRNRIEAMP
ncbi:sensor domain-containing diguanylate cyclase [Ottowia sp.]|uniref:sensor domain-containing diguanylate cyclase n=1 Tax=Ottowia sp. TaxID=1898956 RepID=UPI001D3BCAA7|nr:sensor domain-containing diguanylate cyclase [Ottowia sp.]MCB2025101.1 sensor domain-containing diguanylate cyclase [Ottowia sp.]MCB2034093.1 sensor domain-containing diguanylate cyclase [Ottowia sp.]MCP5259036.1 sensor domain-containing diguanylate cyclase [Burkholderiaceae bacterium]HRW72625.1 sensor domain-containing diguanylate cyclase [Ottowia sp.]